MNYLRKRLTFLWIVTGVAAVVLVVFTLNLRSRALEQEAAGFSGTIGGVNSAVYLYERPSASSRIVTILDLGAPVHVSDSEDDGNIDWYYVNSAGAAGWLPASRVSANPP